MRALIHIETIYAQLWKQNPSNSLLPRRLTFGGIGVVDVGVVGCLVTLPGVPVLGRGRAGSGGGQRLEERYLLLGLLALPVLVLVGLEQNVQDLLSLVLREVPVPHYSTGQVLWIRRNLG